MADNPDNELIDNDDNELTGNESNDTKMTDIESNYTKSADGELPDYELPYEKISEQDTKKEKRILKIILPVILVALIAGIWLIKNNESKESTEVENPDFVLTVSEIDLEHLKSYGLPIIIDFGSDSCGPCIEMAPTLKKINEEWQGKVIVKFVDVWRYTDAADGYPLEVIPTQFIFYADGNPYVPSKDIATSFILYSRQDSNEHVYTAHKGKLTEEEFLAIFEELGVE